MQPLKACGCPRCCFITSIHRESEKGCILANLGQGEVRRGPRLLHTSTAATRQRYARSVLVRYLKEDNFVALYVRYRLVSGLGGLVPQAIRLFLTGSHGFFVFPQGYAEHRAALAVTEGDKPLASVLALYLLLGGPARERGVTLRPSPRGNLRTCSLGRTSRSSFPTCFPSGLYGCFSTIPTEREI
jgi:hypothetical protein